MSPTSARYVSFPYINLLAHTNSRSSSQNHVRNAFAEALHVHAAWCFAMLLQKSLLYMLPVDPDVDVPDSLAGSNAVSPCDHAACSLTVLCTDTKASLSRCCILPHSPRH